MELNIERRILDTLNGALNKQLIDNYKVIRRINGSELSETEIMLLTRPYFKAVEHTYNESGEIHWQETTMQKQFGATIKMAAEAGDAAEAARMFVGTICPMCSAISEHPDDESMSLYNSDQMLVSFMAGQEWLRNRCASLLPLVTSITLESACKLLQQILVAIPENMTVDTAIRIISEYKTK